MDNERRIYTLNGLPPEIVAVTFAKCSRSPQSFDKIAEELNEYKSRQFHEKWVVGYGHSSVAEHAVLSIAIENVSILATKVIEDNRLASFTEKSTRYQQFDKTRYFRPDLGELNKVYSGSVELILDKYTELVPHMREFVRKKYPDISEIELRNRTFDNLRNMLPVCVLTNLGMTINARNLERAIVKLLSHPLQEMKEIGKGLKEAAVRVTPTLVKYTEYNKYIADTVRELEKEAKEILTVMPEETKNVTLVEFDKNAEDMILSSLLYRFSMLPYESVRQKVREMVNEEKEKLLKEALDRIGKFDAPLREFEHAYYTFDILIDYGAFRDIQRHRMMTQTNQEFTPIYGFDIPQEVEEAGLSRDFIECMKNAKNSYKIISERFPKEAQYVLPMAFRKRALFKANFRELYHFIKLRSSRQGHDSYRKIAQQMYQELEQVQPFLAKFIPVSRD